MIIGCECVDPRRIISATYGNLHGDIYEFTLSYLIGQEMVALSQIGTKEECMKWLRKADTAIGKGPLLDAVSNMHLEEEEDEDEEECRTIGFKPPKE